MYIACATDDNFVQHCGVMLVSLFENNKNEDIEIYLLTQGLSQSNKQSLMNICDQYNKKIIFCLIGKSVLEGCPLFEGDHVSMAAYFRLLFSQIIPTNVDKILYLDCDIIIMGSLSPLWNINIDSYSLAAVQEATSYFDNNYQRLKYDSSFSYFNSGVLLVNLNYWRENNLTEKCLNYLKKYPERIRWHDQDILNGVLHENWLRLPIRWNALEGYFYTTFYLNVKISDLEKDQMKNELKNTVIVHYCAKIKPWHFSNRHPLRSEYYKYLLKTEWRNYKPSMKIDKVYLKLQLRFFLVFLRLKKPAYLDTNLS